jgi:succinate dehydrogenase / fumarate reductase flavoprotein subunit
VYLDFKEAIGRLGHATVAGRYGNLFDMYRKITDEDPYQEPMRMYPAIHYTMGGLWVDYNLMSTIPGLHVLGEANFSDHGANRLGASALMQGLADGSSPSAFRPLLASARCKRPPPITTRGQARINGLLAGQQDPRALHRELGRLSGTKSACRATAGLTRALNGSPNREEFWQNVSVPGDPNNLNKNLEYAGRVADYLEFGELLALEPRTTGTCGGHFGKRARRQTARQTR